MAVLFLQEKKEEKKARLQSIVLAKKSPVKMCSHALTAYTGIHRSAQRQMNIVCNSKYYCCALICPSLCQGIDGKKRHMNNFIRSDYKLESKHLISDGIRTEVGRISKFPYEMLIELESSNSSPIFTLHNSS